MLSLAATGCTRRIGVLVSIRNELLVYAGYNNLAVHSLRTHETFLLPAPSPICTIASNDEAIFVGCEGGEYLLYEAELMLNTVPIACSKVESTIAYSGCVKGLAVFGSIDGNVYAVDLKAERSPALIASILPPKRITALGLMEFGTEILLLLAASDLTVTVFHLTADAAVQLLSLSDHHTNWINMIKTASDRRFMTCGQDKNARVWSVSPKNGTNSPSVAEIIAVNRVFSLSGREYTVETEAILIGHDDIVLSGHFVDEKTILTSSSDRTIIKWVEGDDTWQSMLQVGDLAGVGSAGSGDIYDVCSVVLDKTQLIIAHNTNGTLIKWSADTNYHQPQPVASGHCNEVTDIAFDPSGSYFLTCSLDRTVRAWMVGRSAELIEFARPQIHGYELRSIAFLSESVYLSAADEKALRVFKATQQFATRINMVANHQISGTAAGHSVIQPALGLSNRIDASSNARLAESVQLPSEAELSSNTLLPEIDKLYGHLDELQCVAASRNGRFIASASRATLSGDASVRIWDSQRYVEPANNDPCKCLHVLRPHSLTVVQLHFSPDSEHLLSVSRDRRFAVTHVPSGQILWTHEGHERIIWSGAWIDNDRFATASRDKCVKLWTLSSKSCTYTMPFDEAVTALCVVRDRLIVGSETGQLTCLSIEHPQDSRLFLHKCNGRINRICYCDGCMAIACSDHSILLINNF